MLYKSFISVLFGLLVFLSACGKSGTEELTGDASGSHVIDDLGNESASREIQTVNKPADKIRAPDHNQHTAGKNTPQSVPVPVTPDTQVQQELKTEAGRADRESQLVSKAPAPGILARKSIARDMVANMYNFDALRAPAEPVNRENYAHYDDNPVKRTSEHPVSTFSIDVDTGSYANVRRMLNSGALPPKDAVRAEELINYFSYNYPLPENSRSPFALVKEIAPAPWRDGSYLLHLGIQGYELAAEDLPASNLVFLVDVSGSMQSPGKLELLRTSLKLLTRHLTADDRVSLVVYAGASGVVLDPTPGNEKAKIISALDQLRAGGRTNGAAGIRLAYAMAEQGYIKGGINRVLIATDGDFNVGTVDHEQLKNLIEEKRKTGISLSTLGFGTGNYNDHLMEQLADVGNGNYSYIDTINEAQKVLVDEMSSTLMTIAKDVKIQIEFNPAVVAEYRLIGYENRQLKREDFNNDKVDAGEIGAGHSVTALYEITFTGSPAQRIDPLRYQKSTNHRDSNNNELAFLKIRYKDPMADKSKLLSWTIEKNEITGNIDQTSNAYRFAAAVAAFAQQLRGGESLGEFSYTDILTLARSARGDDLFGYRGEFLKLVNLASSIAIASGNDQNNYIAVAR
ncbi:MAG: VWA domain-containing protein [Thiotrichales bacterium]|nr:VWA domain-containing protein [Thiotrichales bacterium]